MSLLAQRRAFLQHYRKTGSLEAAAAAMGLESTIHTEWMKDWLYRGAYQAVEKELKLEKAGKLPPPPPPKRPPGRPRKAIAGPPAPKRPIGRPRKARPETPITPTGSPDEPGETAAEAPAVAQDRPETVSAPMSLPPVQEHVYPGERGYVRLFTPEGEVPAPSL